MTRYCFLFVFIIILFGCNNTPKFNGNRTSNDVQFVMEYSIFNTTKEHKAKGNISFKKKD